MAKGAPPVGIANKPSPKKLGEDQQRETKCKKWETATQADERLRREQLLRMRQQQTFDQSGIYDPPRFPIFGRDDGEY